MDSTWSSMLAEAKRIHSARLTNGIIVAREVAAVLSDSNRVFVGAKVAFGDGIEDVSAIKSAVAHMLYEGDSTVKRLLLMDAGGLRTPNPDDVKLLIKLNGGSIDGMEILEYERGQYHTYMIIGVKRKELN